MLVTPLMQVTAVATKVVWGDGWRVDFTSSGGTLLVYFACSAFSAADGQQIGVTLNIDSTPAVFAGLFANERGSHKALIPAVQPVTGIEAGPHACTVTALDANTQLDGNDYITITVLEFGIG